MNGIITFSEVDYAYVYLDTGTSSLSVNGP